MRRRRSQGRAPTQLVIDTMQEHRARNPGVRRGFLLSDVQTLVRADDRRPDRPGSDDLQRHREGDVRLMLKDQGSGPPRPAL